MTGSRRWAVLWTVVVLLLHMTSLMVGWSGNGSGGSGIIGLLTVVGAIAGAATLCRSAYKCLRKGCMKAFLLECVVVAFISLFVAFTGLFLLVLFIYLAAAHNASLSSLNTKRPDRQHAAGGIASRVKEEGRCGRSRPNHVNGLSGSSG